MSDDTLKVELPQELAEAVLPYAYLLFVEADPERTDHLLRRVGVHVKRAMSEPHDATVVPHHLSNPRRSRTDGRSCLP